MDKPIEIKNWSKGFITKADTTGHFQNIDFDQKGVMRPRKSWKTFAGMVYQLHLINKRYKKLGIEGDFTVRLPLPEGKKNNG